MLIFVLMLITGVRAFLITVLTFSTWLIQAQFSTATENSQPRPLLTKAEVVTDSAHYADKSLAVRDKRTNVIHWVWTEFDKYRSRNPQDSSHIIYARATGGKKNWSEARRISKKPGDCKYGDGSLKPSVPVPGLHGEVYICWASPAGLAFQRSLDSGMTWLPSEKIIAPFVNGWLQTVDGIPVPCAPKMVMDEDGKFKGRLYVTWSDEKNGVQNKDVFLIYSDDRGDNWTDPVLVTYRPNHKDQFSPDLQIQPGTGKLFLTWLDKQNFHDQKNCDYYLGISSNGGLKFFTYKLNSEPVVLDSVLTPVRGLAFVPRSEDAKVVWSQLTTQNKLNIHSVVIADSSLTAYNRRSVAAQAEMPTTIQFESNSILEFELKKASRVSLVVTKPLEPAFSLTVLRDADLPQGKNKISIETKKLKLKKGDYIITLYYDGRNSFTWMLK